MGAQLPRTWYTDEQAREILTRAVRFDTLRAEGLSLTDLRSAAADVGISAESLDAAVAAFELRGPAAERSVAHLPRLLLQFSAVGIGLSLLGEGVVGAMMGGSPLTWAPGLAMIVVMVSGGLASLRSRSGAAVGFLEYQSRNLGLWAGFGYMTFLVAQTVPGGTGSLLRDAVMSAGIMLWGISSAVGGAVAAWRSRVRSDAAAPQPPSGASAFHALKRRTAERLKGWIDVVLRRAGTRTLRATMDTHGGGV